MGCFSHDFLFFHGHQNVNSPNNLSLTVALQAAVPILRVHMIVVFDTRE